MAERCRRMCDRWRRTGIRAGQADRRRAHRHQRALHRGHLCQRPRRAAERCLPKRREAKAQRPTRPGIFPTIPAACAVPICDGTGIDQPGCAVSPGREDHLSQLSGAPDMREEADEIHIVMPTRQDAVCLPELMAMDVQACAGSLSGAED